MIKEAIIKIVNKEDLRYDEAYAVMNEVMSGESSQVQNAAFLAAMSTKSAKAETTDEISGCAAAMRAHATKVAYDKPTLEIVGTGGDGAKTFNISSISALVAAAAGIKVAKHGNRAASSDCGSADFLEASGVNINQDPALCKKLLDEINICFLFAQHYHASMKYVGAIRRELGFRTVFNILGPLTNPASPQYFVLGVYDEYLVWPLANVLKRLGAERALVVYGQDRMDEISASAPSTVCELLGGSFHSAIIKPEDFGLQRGKKEELVGGNPAENVRIAREILSGKERGTRRTAVLLNAGAALYIGGKAESLKEGVRLSGRLIDEGKVLETYEKYIRLSNEEAE